MNGIINIYNYGGKQRWLLQQCIRVAYASDLWPTYHQVKSWVIWCQENGVSICKHYNFHYGFEDY